MYMVLKFYTLCTIFTMKQSKLCFKLGKSVSEILHMMKNVYGNDFLIRSSF